MKLLLLLLYFLLTQGLVALLLQGVFRLLHLLERGRI